MHFFCTAGVPLDIIGIQYLQYLYYRPRVMPPLRPSTRLATGTVTLFSAILLVGSAVKESPRLTQLNIEGNKARSVGNPKLAGVSYEKGFQLSFRLHDFRNQTRFLINGAGAELQQHHQIKAFNLYMEARELARAHRLRLEAGIIDLNLSTLYSLFGDFESANRLAEEGLSGVGGLSHPQFRPQLLAALALLRARQSRTSEAVSCAMEAIIEAGFERDSNGARQRDINTMTVEWDFLGSHMLSTGDLSAAEYAFQQAYQLRRAFRPQDASLSLFPMAWLRVQQGRYREAAALLAQADSQPLRDGAFPEWLVLDTRARVLKTQGNTSAALRCFRQALHAARLFQEEVAPSSSPGLDAQRQLQSLYQDVIETSLATDPVALERFGSYRRRPRLRAPPDRD